MTETLAGLDPSTKPGLAIIQDGKVVHAAGYAIGGKGWPRGRVNKSYRDWLRASLLAHGVDAIAVEMPIPMGNIPGNADTHSQASYFWECAQEVTFSLNIELVGVAIQSWRSFFLGTSVAPKAPKPPEHILATRQKEWQSAWRRKWWKQKAIDTCAKHGIIVKSDDAAEAIGIGFYLHGQRNPFMWNKANDLFALEHSRSEAPVGTLSLKSEAEKVFSRLQD